MDQEKHEFTQFTNSKLNEIRSDYNDEDLNKSEWSMWLDLTDAELLDNSRITLKPVKSDGDYEKLFLLRRDIEMAFGITNPAKVKTMINDIRKATNRFQGRWYLAVLEGVCIGEVGLIPFDFKDKKIGRLKDIDILPEFQGNGFGTEMLKLICGQAKSEQFESLCLMAPVNDWPKDWYQNFGFKKVGEIETPDSLTQN
ncbi:MAG: N-acetylglutamate synthase-like GNAT family acetyltransferase [Bacteriovoracaceae bacterium]|jgi:N-acetylglutamate synthase-like GNAT family acetyltransferase